MTAPSRTAYVEEIQERSHHHFEFFLIWSAFLNICLSIIVNTKPGSGHRK